MKSTIESYVSGQASSRLAELPVYTCIAPRINASGGLSSCFVYSDIYNPIRVMLHDAYRATDSAASYITEFTVA